MRRAAGIALIATACASAPRPAIDPEPDAGATATPREVERDYTLAWRGARIGDARERERWDARGVVLVRDERLRVLRGGVAAGTDARVVVAADRALVASRVEWRALRTDGPPQVGRAIRDAGGWRIEVAGEPVRRAPADAVPEELVPLWVRRDGAFRGDVLLTGRGFALARGEVIATGRAALRATIDTGAGALASDVTVDANRDPLAIVGSDGVVARRADAAALDAPYPPAEVVDRAAIQLDRAPPVDPGAPIALALDGIDRAPPPGLPGQRIAADGGRWRIELTAAPATDSVAPLDAIAQGVFAAGDGDCTAHALAFVARARAAGYDARVVTGWRVDGARLVRHRWAIASIAGAWVAIDPSYGEAPASPRLIGLAESDATTAALSLAELAFAGTDGATATLAP